MSATLTQLPPTLTAGPTEPEPSVHETIIEAKKGWIAVDWGELARQRELLFFLVWRDIKVRYKQATLGILWAVLQPLVNVIVFSLIFGAGFNIASKLGAGKDFPPYAVFVFAGLLPWQFFARALTDGGLSLVNQQHLLTKIYFPRLFVPTAAVGGGLFDMLVSLPIFIAVMAFYRVVPPWSVVFLPFLVAASVLFAAGMAYLLSALTVTYRDFRFIIQFMVQIWMWLSFVMIPVPETFLHRKVWYVISYANPMYGLVSTYRKVLLGMDWGWSPWYLVSAVGWSAVVFVLGVFYFRRTERRFADIA